MKNMKKLISLLLVAAMVMAMGLTAFAETGTQKGQDTTLTINTVAGHTYKVYQMLIGDVDAATLTNGEGTLSNVELGANNNAASAEAFIAAVKDLTGAALGDAAAAYIKGTSVDVVGDDTAIATTVQNGYYVVVDTWTDDVVADANDKDTAISRYMVAVVGATEMTPKTETTPDIDKNITDDDANKALETGDSKKTDTAAIGDVIEYEVTGTVPEMSGYQYYYYVVEDTMSEGLTLNDAENNGFTVTVGGVEQNRGTDYVVIKDGQSFKLAFTHFVDYTANAAISIKYSATVNEKANIGLDPNTNTAKLVFSNNPNTTKKPETTPDTPPSDEPEKYVPGNDNPTGVTPNHVTKTYVTQLTIVKVDENNAILDGAEFTLTGENLNEVRLTTATTFVEDENGTYYKLTDGTFTLTAPHGDILKKDAEGNVVKDADGNDVVETASNEAAYASTTTKYAVQTTVSTDATAVTDSKVVAELKDGAFTITGLNAGDYTLTETKTPAGYNTIPAISFKITATQNGTTTALEGTAITWSDNSEKIEVDATNAVFTATIQNVKGNLLPSTGGIGTTIFYVLGTILVLGAGVVLVAKKRVA